MYKFKRPESLSFPQSYHTFKAKDKNSDEVIEYRVQDLPEKYYEKAVEFMVKFYLPDEPFAVSIGVVNNKNAVQEFCSFWLNIMKQKFSVACLRNDGSDELVAVNVLIVNSKEDPPIDVAQYKETEFIDILKSLKFTANQFNVYEAYNVNHYLSGQGLCINPAYRGRGIATEMMKARVPILQILNLKISSTPFSNIGSQTAAKNAGQKESFVISFEEIEKKFPRFDFSKCQTKYFKTMDLEV